MKVENPVQIFSRVSHLVQKGSIEYAKDTQRVSLTTTGKKPNNIISQRNEQKEEDTTCVLTSREREKKSYRERGYMGVAWGRRRGRKEEERMRGGEYSKKNETIPNRAKRSPSCGRRV